MGHLIIERTGEVFSFSSNEFRVTYPDGYVGTIWSPPWHEMTEEQETEEARKQAVKLFEQGEHKSGG